MNIIKLTGVLSHSGEPIFVNLDNVSFYHYDSSPGGSKFTQIYFGSDDHWVRAKETPLEIQKIIEEQEGLPGYIPLEDDTCIPERKAEFWAKAINLT